MEFVSDRRYRYPVPPEELWSTLSETSDYRRWWPWLRDLEATGLAPGEQWRCTVRPPLPYSIRFTIHFDDVDPPSAVTAHVTGDIAGVAHLDVTPLPDGCEVRLMSTLTPSSRAFGLIASFAGPLIRRGHDWVLDTGARQFAARAVNTR